MAKICSKCGAANPNYSEMCVCGQKLESAPAAELQPGQHGDRMPLMPVGALFIFIGLACAVYFAFAFDTTFAASTVSERVHNTGLQQQRELGVLGGLLFSILGAVLMNFRKGGS